MEGMHVEVTLRPGSFTCRWGGNARRTREVEPVGISLDDITESLKCGLSEMF